MSSSVFESGMAASIHQTVDLDGRQGLDEQAQRLVLRELGKALGWPQLDFLPYLSIVAGEHDWTLAAAKITPEQLAPAVAVAWKEYAALGVQPQITDKRERRTL